MIEAISIASMLCAAAFSIDRIAKMLVMNDVFSPQVLIGGVLAVVKHRNFGLLANLPVPLHLSIAINVLALGVLLYAIWQSANKHKRLECLALGVLLGGAMGNLFDRIVFGYVFDWLMWFDLSIVNLADAFIALGMAAYLYANYKKTTR